MDLRDLRGPVDFFPTSSFVGPHFSQVASPNAAGAKKGLVHLC